MSSPSKGITISVTAETNAGGRKHMEDYLAVKLCPNEELRSIPHLKEQAYIGVFDGHGGKEAAKFAREKLWDTIQAQPKFRQEDVQSVQDGIQEAFLALHTEMEPLREKWKRNKTGDLSTAGTTASTVIFRQNHIYVANVGDSTAILAQTNPRGNEPGQHPVVAKVLTKDHKPEDPEETRQIEKLGGQVMLSRKRVPRVVWERVGRTVTTTISDSTDGTAVEKVYRTDHIPFLSVSRSLGDFWSFNPRTKQYVVSPKPDVYVHNLNTKEQKFIVIASDGLWNVMSPKDVVEFVWDYEHNDQCLHQPRDVVRAVINEALKRWSNKNLLADNIAVLIAFLSEGDEQSPSVAGIRSINDDAPTCSTSAESASSTPSPDTAVTTPPRVVSHTPSVINERKSSKSGSTSYYKETYADGVTIEYHTKIKLRHHKKQRTTSCSPADSAKRLTTPPKVKRERPDELSAVESPPKRAKVDPPSGDCSDHLRTLPDSGLDTGDDSMDHAPSPDHSSEDHAPSPDHSSGDHAPSPDHSSEDHAPSSDHGSKDHAPSPDHTSEHHAPSSDHSSKDHAPSSDHSSGVFSDEGCSRESEEENLKMESDLPVAGDTPSNSSAVPV